MNEQLCFASHAASHAVISDDNVPSDVVPVRMGQQWARLCTSWKRGIACGRCAATAARLIGSIIGSATAPAFFSRMREIMRVDIGIPTAVLSTNVLKNGGTWYRVHKMGDTYSYITGSKLRSSA